MGIYLARGRALSALLLAFAVTGSAPLDASACGGFFCSSVPVDQVGEQILFGVEGTTVTAHIQIAYAGEAEKFSWVLPLPSVPKLAVGTGILFSRLRALTDPRFEVLWKENGECKVEDQCLFDSAESSPSAGNGGGGGVTVLDEGEVGSFEFKVVEGDGDALFAWLNENGYDQPDAALPLVQHYSNQSYKFVALKLQKGKATGDITPIVATFESPTLACVPLKLTAIAASEDMPVFTWVLAEARAVPMNFFHVTLNPKAYPWLECGQPAEGSSFWYYGGFGGTNCQQAYLDLVTKAADAANGHAFVTEFAGKSDLMTDQIYKEGQFDLGKLGAISNAPEFLNELLNQGFPRNPLMQEIIRTHIPKPDASALPEDCQSDQEFYTWNIETCLSYMPSDWSFDGAGMTADIDERIVTPMKEAQALVSAHGYLTRLFTTISPDEMTKDPMFSFNPDLADVNHIHRVEATPLCAPGSTSPNQVELKYSDGEVVVVPGSFQECGGFLAEDDATAGQPAFGEVQVLNESGAAETVKEGELDTKEAELDTRAPNPDQAAVPQRDGLGEDPTSGTFGNNPNGPSTGGGSGGGSGGGDSSSGCSSVAGQSNGTGALVMFGLLVLGLAFRRRLGTLVVLLAVCGSLAAPRAAEACGGFFCSSVPVDQVGEHILFAVEGTEVTAHIQIAYAGDAEKFSWVLPLPSLPKLAVGTDALFTRLRALTDPRFYVEWQESECTIEQPCAFAGAEDEDGSSPPSDPGSNGVTVLDEGEVGSFEFKVVEGDGDALFAWLNENGYDQPEAALPLVQHYANQSYKFVALKLQKGKATGDITPIVAKFDSPTLACVPLKLTAIAAADDMPVFTWVLAKARAVPMNFFHVTLNPKAYPWLQCGQPQGSGGFWWFGGGQDCSKAYIDLVTKAADSANGHAFVTEFAGDSELMKDQVYKDGQFDMDKLKGTTNAAQYLNELLSQGFPRNPLMQEIIRTWIPKPDKPSADCESDQQFYSWNTEKCLEEMPEGWTFDAAGMTADIDERIVKPMAEAQALFKTHTYLTRMFTTISPDEMTKDPMFSFNPDLPNVSHEHTVKATPLCAGGETDSVEIEYPNGETEVVKGTFEECGGFVVSGDAGSADEPAFSEIQILSEDGQAEAVDPGKVSEREPELETRAPDPGQANVPQNPDVPEVDDRSGTFGEPRDPGPATNPTGSGAPSGGSEGCSQTSGDADGTGVLLLLGLAAGLLFFRRRSASALLVAALLVSPLTADACGGFFCSQVPVDQRGEMILFAVDGEDVTAHIQIQYSGDAEKFSWVLPLPTQPTLGTSTPEIFNRLRALTDPQFQIEWKNDDNCNVTNDCQFAIAEADGAGGGGGEGGGVVVLEEGETGPFTFKILEGDGDALFTWLNDNGYDQPEDAKPLVQYYANQSYKFVALKLQKGKATGEIRPLVAKYKNSTLACVPLKLTSIAATPDMPVFSWILGDSRAVPINYFHVVLNAKKYDWLKCASPYGWGGGGFWFPGYEDCIDAYWSLVTEAANAANGHAFVTEFAGSAALMKDQITKDGQFDLEKLAAILTPGAFMQEMMAQQFPRNVLTQEIIKSFIPKPAEEDLPEDCKSDQQFYATWNIDECIQYMPADWTFDAAGMTAELDDAVVTPMKDAQKLFDSHHYVTRMFTTISPDEMTKDPTFSFNPDLPDVSNVHKVEAKAVCKPGSTNEAAAVEITFADGSTQLLEGEFSGCGNWDITGGGAGDGEAAYADIQIMSESGEAESIKPEDVATREPEIETRSPNPGQGDVPQNPDRPAVDDRSGTFGTPADDTTPPAESSSGCSHTDNSGNSAPILLFGLLLLGLIRRRAS